MRAIALATNVTLQFLRDLPHFLIFAIIVCSAWLYARLFGRVVTLGLFISGNKEIILRHARPNSAIFRARIMKPRTGSLGVWARMGRTLLWNIARNAPDSMQFFCWGYADLEIFGDDLTSAGVPVGRLETGLLGYGAPSGADVVSYVLDWRAPYFDGRRATDLEALLNAYSSGEWRQSPETMAFVERAKASRFQKYDTISGALDLDLGPSDIVVVGQVTGDMALQATHKAVDGNVDLIARAVAESPADARVFFKAHPMNRDLDAETVEIKARFPEVRFIDANVSFAQIAHCRPTIVVMTSGAGLEAALRGCRVICYGVSFYSNWGATDDRCIVERRSNTLKADDVFFVAMARYARYFDRKSLRTLSASEVVLGPTRATSPIDDKPHAIDAPQVGAA